MSAQRGRRHAIDRTDLLLGLGFVIGGSLVVAASQTTPTIPGQVYGPGFFPFLIGCALIAGGGIMAVRAVTEPTVPETAVSPPARGPAHLLTLAFVIVGLVACIFLLEPVGFIPVTTALTAGFMMLLRVSPLVAAPLALAGSVVVTLIFSKILLVPLPSGLLQGWI
ncbi:MAG: tripartite tricarboxylate transporter TctB family protein [Burkholderiales bacterium]|jgi:putative tricarboxylic transport membrane protein|nr:tripartite tricarboxylate transporter TctB family protein [Burkholderiales bacterium]